MKQLTIGEMFIYFNAMCSVFKTSLHYQQVAVNPEPEAADEAGGGGGEVEETAEVTAEDVGGFEDAVDKFYSSIKSRMMVGEVSSHWSPAAILVSDWWIGDHQHREQRALHIRLLDASHACLHHCFHWSW